MEAAGAYLGLDEWPGAKHNPTIVGFFAATGNSWVKDDETPWCAAFVGAVLAQLGLPNTGRLNARSYLDWGTRVSLNEARTGDVVILSRPPSPAAGHIGFLVSFSGDKVVLRGGNQSNSVTDAAYPVSRIIGIRRASGTATVGRPILRQGGRGANVLDLQDQLRSLGYFAGTMDASFGPLTAQAVMAFQNDAGLQTDAVVGSQTWDALAVATPRKPRDVSAADVRASGSTTMKNADKTDTAAAVAGVAVTLTAVKEAAAEATGLIPTLEALLVQHWPLLLAGLAIVAVLVFSNRIKAARVKDAQTGANIAR